MTANAGIVVEAIPPIFSVVVVRTHHMLSFPFSIVAPKGSDRRDNVGVEVPFLGGLAQRRYEITISQVEPYHVHIYVQLFTQAINPN